MENTLVKATGLTQWDGDIYISSKRDEKYNLISRIQINFVNVLSY